MSLDPTQASGRFFRPGISWFVQTQFMGNAAEKPENLTESLDSYRNMAEKAVESSARLADIDLDTEDGIGEAIDLVGKDVGVPEFWALRLGIFAEVSKAALANGEAAEAVWGMQKAALARCMLIFVRSMEELVWRGYRTFGVVELEAALKLWQEAPPKATESFWQAALAEHSFVLSQIFSAPMIVIQGQPYLGGKGFDNKGGDISDFLTGNPLTGAAALVEIKKPASKLLGRKYRGNVFPPSVELSGAVAQAVVNRDTLTKNFQNLSEKNPDVFPYDPVCVVIAGHTDQLDSAEKLRSFELYRRGLKDVHVATFDEVFRQAQVVLDLVQRHPKQAPPQG